MQTLASTRLRDQVASGVLGVALVLGTGGCGGRAASAPAVCTSANEYIWFGSSLAGGPSGNVPQGAALRTALAGMGSALSDLARSVPADHRDDVRGARALLVEVAGFFRRYDYAAGPTDIPPGAFERLAARHSSEARQAQRLTRYLLERCSKTSTPFPTDPRRTPG